jgi:hypothetical protein
MGPAQTRPDQARPDQTRPDQTRPDQTRPDQTRPDQTRPDQTRPVDNPTSRKEGDSYRTQRERERESPSVGSCCLCPFEQGALHGPIRASPALGYSTNLVFRRKNLGCRSWRECVAQCIRSLDPRPEGRDYPRKTGKLERDSESADRDRRLTHASFSEDSCKLD